MRAVLDHIGIAVSDLPAALAFFRDGLGLEVRAPEEVPSQQVRAHCVPVGESVLELLEATSSESPIARSLARRGPGLHHITLRVDDLQAALDHLARRGVRLVDRAPRPGAAGALVAFVHPSSTNGVLVELKQSVSAAHDGEPVSADEAVAAAAPLARRIALGELELVSLSDGFFALDGGAMFGVVPKTLWGRHAPADARNRIRLGLRPLVVRGARTMIIDAGIGDKMPAKLVEIYAIDRRRHLDHALAEAGLSVQDIDIVLASHLHFDHAGGFTTRDARGALRPRFPRAQYVVRRGEWEDAQAATDRNRASYLAENYQPLADAGVLQLVDEDATIMPGVRVKRTGGHTRHHQMVVIESQGRTAVFAADFIPTVAHLPDLWGMGYDLYPMETFAGKQAFVPEAIAREHLVFFEHDPVVAAAYIRERDGRRVVERVL
jgi:methylmalonyl-CoA epimerase